MRLSPSVACRIGAPDRRGPELRDRVCADRILREDVCRGERSRVIATAAWQADRLAQVSDVVTRQMP